jgi:HEAT repeat protein
VAALGHERSLSDDELAQLRAAARDPEPVVRAVAVAALVRAAPVRVAAPAWRTATRDPVASVRRRAAEVAPALSARRRVDDADAEDALVALLGDVDVTVVEAAAWALGERGERVAVATVRALADVAVHHDDPLAREAAVAALGAIGHPGGLDAILTACADKPAVRRRAVLALAPFAGAAVDTAIETALGDRDWQVRQAAEDLRRAEE